MIKTWLCSEKGRNLDHLQVAAVIFWSQHESNENGKFYIKFVKLIYVIKCKFNIIMNMTEKL